MRARVLMLIPAVCFVACVTPRPPTTVPLALAGNRAMLTADINGHKVHLILELAYDAPIGLTRATLDRIGVAPTGPSYPVQDLKGDTMEAATFEMPRIDIGSAVFTNVKGRVDVHDPSSPPAQFDEEGFIGPSLFSGYRIVLNYQRGTMTLIPPGNRHIQRAGCIRAGVPFLIAVAKAQTDFGNLTLVFDTGEPVSLISKTRIDKAQIKVVNNVVRTQLFRLNDVDSGPFDFVPLDVPLPRGADGIVGGNFFDQNVVCFDFPSQNLVQGSEFRTAIPSYPPVEQ